MDKIAASIIHQVAFQAMAQDDEIKLSDSFERLGLDSLDGLELIVFVEDEFDISVKDDEVSGLNTVNDLVEFVRRKTEIS